ncbi:Yhc1p NDAI_0I01810 [Naumovozyma dairenensis CBS 421]|uniref:Matrin-type domain-containing protein n=1 Tax=Naumovozyma dairenensis (strain ATCC 10597 / BCRC 20456 / CBS 421 / NBRC 0211 / NRRL Y-12639) TaxID=1071378 RepID=G0WG39_NAUDC|nr:hypothetical protein NDAI_0I01810 [Naumovozyma dairenensis CBS 421]CCD26750.1 hypothetical protein NDAI_0I01810 [Naumovozyma dairenensis CBS 421]
MARYYCEYCHSYLTHDTLSVRKSHLVGKNHIRITADYYRNKNVQQYTKCTHRDRSRHNAKGKTQSHHRSKITKVSDELDELNRLKKTPKPLLKNKEKKVKFQMAKIFQKELNKMGGESMLAKLYDGSPGYSKVFIDSNRLDIGDSVRLNKLPQRANERSSSTMANDNNTGGGNRDRNEVFINNYAQSNSSSSIIEPPRMLSIWSHHNSGTFPKTSIYHEDSKTSILNSTISSSRKRIMMHSHSRPSIPAANASTSGGHNGGGGGGGTIKRRRYGN